MLAADRIVIFALIVVIGIAAGYPVILGRVP